MFIDARELADGSRLAADVCIVGAGAAGLTLARELAPNFDVCVFESGGLEADAATQDLARGTGSGQPYPPVEATRSRFFGGSTNCWQGYCRPLGRLDLASRSWVPDSGWPIDRDELEPFYRRAARTLGLARIPESDRLESKRPESHPDWSDTGLQDGLFQFGREPVRMGSAWRSEIETAPRLRVVLHANLTHIALHADGAHVEALELRTLDGRRLEARARTVVLAAGGLENPRLLLASKDVQRGGVGNEHDLVGRYFMEHPHVRFHAKLLAYRPSALRFYEYRPVPDGHVRGILEPSEAWQREERALTHSIQLRRIGRSVADRLEAALARSAKETDAAPGAESPVPFGLVLHHEQAPNPESRVTLGRERDRLGVPRLHLHWALTELDRDSARKALRQAATSLALARLGRAGLDDEALADEWPADTTGGNHHMGTTRMHDDPTRGVVDAHCRVHGVDNLYVAGSSVFPTAGAANPTWTLVALAHRLAGHLMGTMA